MALIELIAAALPVYLPIVVNESWLIQQFHSINLIHSIQFNEIEFKTF